MCAFNNVYTYINDKLELIDKLEKEHNISAKQIFNTNKSNKETLEYELLHFLLSITKYEKTTETQCAVFSAITKENMTKDKIDALKKIANHDIPFYSLQLFILSDMKNKKTYYDGISHELFKLFENLGNNIIYTASNTYKAVKIKNQHIERMAEIIVTMFTQEIT